VKRRTAPSGSEFLEFERVTTRGGDRGETSLYDGTRLRKDDLVFETMGDLDELASFLGLLKASLGRSVPNRRRITKDIEAVQRVLLRIGSMIATPPSAELYSTLEPLGTADIDTLEAREHALLEAAEVPEQFILPGENREAALADVARTICRRVERHVVSCIRDRYLGHLSVCQRYLNRLSDYLFILARYLT